MQSSVPPLVLWTLFVGFLAVAGFVIGIRAHCPAWPSYKGTVIASLPGLLLLAAFYSLAFHMYRSLGGWPKSIGERGFPEHLILHGEIAIYYFGILFFLVALICPVVFVVCLAFRPWRGGLYYLGVFVLMSFACFGAMMLAPSKFLNWWWD